ncbi:MAG: SpoVG family protein [Planctomycetota bacterium]
MEISEVRISAVGNRDDKLRAFCSVTFDDCFVVRDIRIIEGNKGLFIAMPSRKLSIRCPGCGFKNVVRSQYCNNCGNSIPRALSEEVERGRTKLHADIAHPILTEFREEIQNQVLVAFDRHFEEMDANDKEERSKSRDSGRDSGREEAKETAPAMPRARGPAEEKKFSEEFRPAVEEKAEEKAEEAGEAEFLRKEPEQEKSSSGRRGADLPPPDDNFSSGLF